MLEQFSTPMIFGHRGASAHAPENTLASFELAVRQGADAIELDVKLTADHQAVVIHDQTVDRTTNGRGKVNQLKLDDIKTLDAGSFFDPEYQDQRIPTLDEVFEHVGKRIFINVELTNYFSPGDDLIPVVARIVERHQLHNSVLFSSFNPWNLKKMRALLPTIPVGILCNAGITGALTRSNWFTRISPKAIHPYLTDVDIEFVEKEHRRGRRIHVWTVNGEQNLRRMADLRVDGVFTDDPILALQVLGRL